MGLDPSATAHETAFVRPCHNTHDPSYGGVLYLNIFEHRWQYLAWRVNHAARKPWFQLGLLRVLYTPTLIDRAQGY